MKSSRAALAAFLLAGAAWAQTWNQTGPNLDLPPGSITSGSGALTQINGSISGTVPVMVYAIYIANPAAFSASTVSLTSLDTALYLFNSAGVGVAGCDNTQAFTYQSTLTNTFVRQPGLYYLAISHSQERPVSISGFMWNIASAGEYRATGPGGADALSYWSGQTPDSGTFGIALTGVEYAVDLSNHRCGSQFRAPVNLNTQGGPNAMATGDFNGDGILDIAMPATNANAVYIRYGAGDGQFSAIEAFTCPAGPTNIAVADVNHDGRPDIITTHASAGSVAVFLNQGNHTFSQAAAIPVGTWPTSIAVGDLNYDGKLDLVIGHYSVNYVSVLMGNGNGTFVAPANVTAGSSPIAVALADFNGDAKLDLAVANQYSNTLMVMNGQGNGTFAAPSTYSTGAQPDAVCVGDFNRDGKADIAVGCYSASAMTILMGNGGGGFASTTTPTDSTIISAVAADINRDGVLDLVTAENSRGTISVQYGTGAGQFRSPVPIVVGSLPVSPAVGDFNRDGLPDIAVALPYANQIAVTLQRPDEPAPTISAPGSVTAAAGTLAHFSVSVTPATSAFYQWRRNGAPLADGPGAALGSRTPNLTVGVHNADNGAVFDCVVTTDCGSYTSAPASLIVAPACPADYNGDGVADLFDYLDFIETFSAGC